MLEKVIFVLFCLGFLGGSAILVLSLTGDLENFAEFPNLYIGWFGFGFVLFALIIISKLKSK